MAELKGTNIAAGIVPFTDLDKYPTHYSKYGKGGYMTVETIEERDSIPDERKEVGMLCYVIEDNTNIHTYRLGNDWEWETVQAAGIPIYGSEELDRFGVPANGKYIFIPGDSDLSGETETNTITTSINGSYLDILFNTIRQLQAEVSKIRNTFRYGLYSYTGTDTAMSGIVSEIIESDDEPLWAVDPDMLSSIVGADVSISADVNNLEPINNLLLTENKFVIGENSVKWFDKDDLVKGTEDPKLFIYFTVSHINIKLTLEEITENEEKSELEIDLSELGNNIVDLEKYRILFILSRKTGEEKKEGKNYIWISISNPETNIVLKEGYLNINSNKLSNNLIVIDKEYTIKNIDLVNLNLYQLEFYSKYQEFTQEVIPGIPSDQDYMYRVAHLTIRSVSNKEELESIKELLPDNELIYEEKNKKLYIKSNGSLIAIVGSGGSSDNDNDNDNDMTPQQLIEELKKLGIVYTDENGLQLNSIADVTFVHQATGKQFKFEVDTEGELRSSELPKTAELLESRINALKDTVGEINTDKNVRGFVAKLHCGETKSVPDINTKNDVKINSDRVKIGAVYMPLVTDTTFGCSHAFIELENTSDKDFPLNGCYLHYIHPNKDNSSKTDIEHLALGGVLRAGSTFLIRGKQYSDSEVNSGTYINVDDFDMEWYIGNELIDLSVDISSEKPYGFALTYGNNENIGSDNDPVVEISPETVLVSSNNDPNTVGKASRIFVWYFIDSLPINGHVSTSKTWGQNAVKPSSNSIIKNTFELDPAKQAFQALNTYDSSRERLANTGNDVQILNLNKETISFPNSEEEYPISRFTPKASKYKKNVCTDKTPFDQNKPNAVTCAFGIDVYKTRCFNWVSGGEFDEYVWVRREGDSNWERFESYKKISSPNSQNTSKYPSKKEFSVDINNNIYARLVGRNFPGCNIHYTSHKCILDIVKEPVNTPTVYEYIVGRADKSGNPDSLHCSNTQTFTLYPKTYKPKIYLTTDQQGFHWIEYQAWSAAANYISDKINREVQQAEETNNKIFPVLLNSGDMTQNGTRVNEWLDYFNGGKPLLNHLEHMAVVGNNDLCGPDPEILGTGDDSGKSNSFYFHVFFCYEVDSTGTVPAPMCNGKYIPSLYYFDTDDYRFIMANSEITFATCKTWYGLDRSTSDYNRVSNIYTGYVVKEIAGDTLSGINKFDNSFTSIYTMMWKMLDSKGNKKPIITCHEMPFTVITYDCIGSGTTKVSRSVSGSSLVGCHMNQLNTLDNSSMYWFSRLCEYFKVRLVLGGHKHTYAATLPVREYYIYTDIIEFTIESNRIISISGNIEYPIEDTNKITIDSTVYTIGDEEIIDNNGVAYPITSGKVSLPVPRNSKDHGPMVMPETLENDKSYWILNDKHLSKFPLLLNYTEKTNYPNGNNDDSSFFPFTEEHIEGLDPYKENRVVYFMCQATGYKQTSNKELPTNFQSFSSLIPKTTRTNGKDSADNQQKYPMLLNVTLNNNNWGISLERIGNIMSSNYKFNQTTYGKGNMYGQYAILLKNSGKFCYWVNDFSSAIDLSSYADQISNITQEQINAFAEINKLYKLGNKYYYCTSQYSSVTTNYTIDETNKKVISADGKSYDINSNNVFSINNIDYTITGDTITGSNGSIITVVDKAFDLTVINNAVIDEVISENTLNIEL